MSPIHEILLEASEGDLDRLLSGLPPETAGQVIRGAELELAPSGLSERVRELLGARTHQILFAPPAAARELEAAVRSDPGIRLEGIREIASAAFDFRVEAYSEAVRDNIRGFLCTASAFIWARPLASGAWTPAHSSACRSSLNERNSIALPLRNV